jgi:hypothetical protein
MRSALIAFVFNAEGAIFEHYQSHFSF